MSLSFDVFEQGLRLFRSDKLNMFEDMVLLQNDLGYFFEVSESVYAVKESAEEHSVWKLTLLFKEPSHDQLNFFFSIRKFYV